MAADALPAGVSPGTPVAAEVLRSAQKVQHGAQPAPTPGNAMRLVGQLPPTQQQCITPAPPRRLPPSMQKQVMPLHRS